MVVYSNIGNERRENGEDKLKEEGMDGYFLLAQSTMESEGFVLLLSLVHARWLRVKEEWNLKEERRENRKKKKEFEGRGV